MRVPILMLNNLASYTLGIRNQGANRPRDGLLRHSGEVWRRLADPKDGEVEPYL